MSQKCRVAAALIIMNEVKKKRKRSTWVRKWISRRGEDGAHAKLLRELFEEDTSSYKNSVCMSPEDFHYLLEIVSPKIRKRDTQLRKAITPSERLAVTLRFLVSGDSYHSLMHLFRIPVPTISIIVPEVCEALYTSLQEDFLKVPNSNEEWNKVADEFQEKCQFPNCMGAIDGRHIVLKQPQNSGSLSFNYKGTNSIVLMALVDANYKFLYIDVGCNGRISDGGVFANCSLSQALENNILNVPNGRPLDYTRSNRQIPLVAIGDDAFPLKGI
ncbi:putative nuclease HARBI1 [Macrobrachium rosenbergii]|uniref:putative nuclease HARBI1 n=1 Tax=Macrobrachium rosenbergii TaxID=79674 RepID=UPI0034D5F482